MTFNGRTKLMDVTMHEATSPNESVAPTAPALLTLELPDAVRPLQVEWGYACSIIAIHFGSLFVLAPWYFSWTGVVLAIVGLPVYSLLGITLCYHRILTHQGLTLPKWLEHYLAILGVCCLQDTPARWAGIHRLHHQHSDRQPDPHSPLVNFFWAHVGWVLVRNRDHSRLQFFEQYARDILRDPFYLRLEQNFAWFWVYWLHGLAYYLVGLAWGWLSTGQWAAGSQFGTSLLVWGVFARTVVVWHITWAVNSVTHMWGCRNYDTNDDCRNNWLVALFSYGEGWHNNHHADQRAAAHGHRWWEYDMTYRVIQLLEIMGLAKNVVRPRTWPQEQGPQPREHAPVISPQSGPRPAYTQAADRSRRTVQRASR